MPYTDIFRGFKARVKFTRIRFETRRNRLYTRRFRELSRARDNSLSGENFSKSSLHEAISRKSYKARNALARESRGVRNLPYTGKFRQKSLKRFLKFNLNFRIFKNIGELEQNWCNNGAQFRNFAQLSKFSIFKIENKFEIERRKGKIDPPILKIFWPYYV